MLMECRIKHFSKTLKRKKDDSSIFSFHQKIKVRTYLDAITQCSKFSPEKLKRPKRLKPLMQYQNDPCEHILIYALKTGLNL